MKHCNDFVKLCNGLYVTTGYTEGGGEKSMSCRNFCVIKGIVITSVCLFVLVVINKENRVKLEILQVVLW